MKIICTQEEKENIVLSMAYSKVYCPFESTKSVVCTGDQPGECKECIEKNVEWEIEDGKQDGC